MTNTKWSVAVFMGLLIGMVLGFFLATPQYVETKTCEPKNYGTSWTPNIVEECHIVSEPKIKIVAETLDSVALTVGCISVVVLIAFAVLGPRLVKPNAKN